MRPKKGEGDWRALKKIKYKYIYTKPRVFFGRHDGISNIQNTFNKNNATCNKNNNDIKLGLQNYTAIIQTENSCIKFNNIKKNILQGMALHNITQFYTK
jgi:hypothetical protein